METTESKFYRGILNPYNDEPSLAVINQIDQTKPDTRFRFYYELIAFIPDPTSLGWTTFVRELLSSPIKNGFHAAEQLAEQEIKAEYKKAGKLPQYRDMLKAGDEYRLCAVDEIPEAEFKKQFRAIGGPLPQKDEPDEVRPSKGAIPPERVSPKMLQLIDKIEKDRALKSESFRALIVSLRPVIAAPKPS